jgi:hypothetical protein
VDSYRKGTSWAVLKLTSEQRFNAGYRVVLADGYAYADGVAAALIHPLPPMTAPAEGDRWRLVYTTKEAGVRLESAGYAKVSL